MANRMITLKVENWDEFYRLASCFITNEGRWVFRGQTKAEWELKTTLERESAKCKNKAKVKKRFPVLEDFLCPHTRSNENEQIESFKALTQWDHYLGEHKLPYLAAMQHYGFPTRLLDFSRSLFIAVYFAFEDRRSRGDRAVWAIRIDPLWDNVKTAFGIQVDAADYEVEKRILEVTDGLIDGTRSLLSSVKHGVLPLLTAGNNPRLKAQNGLFLMPFSIDGFFANLERSFSGGLVAEPYYAERGAPCKPHMSLDDYLSFKLKKEVVVMKIVCSKKMKKMAGDVFQQMNLTTERIFPDKSFADVRDSIEYRFWYK